MGVCVQFVGRYVARLRCVGSSTDHPPFSRSIGGFVGRSVGQWRQIMYGLLGISRWDGNYVLLRLFVCVLFFRPLVLSKSVDQGTVLRGQVSMAWLGSEEGGGGGV